MALSTSVSGQGFHLTASSRIRVDDWSLVAHCSLHVLHVLPPDVYADPYELALRPAYSSRLHPASDLELPVAAVNHSDSVLILDVHAPRTAPDVLVDVPLHARYGNPAPASYHPIALPSPLAFWACPSSARTLAHPPAPPPQLQPYLSPEMFSSHAISLIPSSAADERADIVIPVGTPSHLPLVDIGTASVMLLMFVYLVYASISTAQRLHSHHRAKKD
ncbi:hypothetical protein IEO21_08124 [Rhodonia placenta]|uniref:Protein PBN1 n=1 Tax=Rhodonia placenta TaxID=104341 RepID=A0A8H7NWW4_9APHY|nr:hypothetical protein IEO21_08124 [Postia placenta]